MNRQTILGVIFLFVGLVVALAALTPVLSKQLPSLTLVGIGLGTALFGAWLMPSSHVGETVNQISVTVGNTNLPFVGGRGRRSGDAITKDIELPPPGGAA